MIWLIDGIAILIGVAMLFWGYRLFRVWLAIAGFLLGTVIGNMISVEFLPDGIWPIVLPLGFGLLLAALAFSVIRFGAVLVGAFLGAVFSSLFFGLFGVEPTWWTYIIGALLGGFLAGAMVVPFIKIASAFNGAYLIMLGIFALISNVSINDQQQVMLSSHKDLSWYFYVGLVVLATVGIIAQFNISKGSDPHSELSNKRS